MHQVYYWYSTTNTAFKSQCVFSAYYDVQPKTSENSVLLHEGATTAFWSRRVCLRIDTVEEMPLCFKRAIFIIKARIYMVYTSNVNNFENRYGGRKWYLKRYFLLLIFVSREQILILLF